MLKTSFIISNKDEVIKLLSKRGFDANNMVNEIIAFDKKRKSIQVQYEETLAEINSISKTIGELFQSGEVSKTKPLKDKSSDLKKLSKDLNRILLEEFVPAHTGKKFTLAPLFETSNFFLIST